MKQSGMQGGAQLCSRHWSLCRRIFLLNEGVSWNFVMFLLIVFTPQKILSHGCVGADGRWRLWRSHVQFRRRHALGGRRDERRAASARGPAPGRRQVAPSHSLPLSMDSLERAFCPVGVWDVVHPAAHCGSVSFLSCLIRMTEVPLMPAVTHILGHAVP